MKINSAINNIDCSLSIGRSTIGVHHDLHNNITEFNFASVLQIGTEQFPLMIEGTIIVPQEHEGFEYLSKIGDSVLLTHVNPTANQKNFFKMHPKMYFGVINYLLGEDYLKSLISYGEHKPFVSIAA